MLVNSVLIAGIAANELPNVDKSLGRAEPIAIRELMRSISPMARSSVCMS